MSVNQLSLPLNYPKSNVVVIDTGHTQCHTFKTSYGAEVRMYQPNKEDLWTNAEILWLLEQVKHSLLND